MDDLDHASQIEAQYRALAIAAATHAARGATAGSEKSCQNEACGEPIPEERRRAVPGCQFCIECQARREQAIRRRHACR